MNILHEDQHIIVCIKPPEVVSEQTADKTGFADLLAMHTGTYIGVIHRLDRGVGGIMVYAKTPHAAKVLSQAVQERRLQKEYYAIVHGLLEMPSGSMQDLLFHDRRQNKTFVVERDRAGVKKAILDYETRSTQEIAPYGPLSLVRVTLHTGRTHQIRVQFASRAHALLGDGKYGASGDRCPIALFSSHLAFPHPVSGKPMDFTAVPTGEIWSFFRDAI